MAHQTIKQRALAALQDGMVGLIFIVDQHGAPSFSAIACAPVPGAPGPTERLPVMMSRANWQRQIDKRHLRISRLQFVDDFRDFRFVTAAQIDQLLASSYHYIWNFQDFS